VIGPPPRDGPESFRCHILLVLPIDEQGKAVVYPRSGGTWQRKGWIYYVYDIVVSEIGSAR
jgi:hypothetical protein